MDTAMHMLYRLVALLAFAASALGCDHPHRSFTQRSTDGGVDQLYSRVEITATGAEFHCIASRSGACHYTLFAHACGGNGPCTLPPIRQLSVAVGGEQLIDDVPRDVQLCVALDATPMNARCQRRNSGS